MVYIKKFVTEAQKQACTAKYQYLSYTFESRKANIHYEQLFCRLTLNNGDVVEIEGSGDLTTAMTKQYSATTVSAEIGRLCDEISWQTFSGFTSLSSVTINNSVTRIGQNAFKDCTSLSSIKIDGNVIIGDNAFSNCTSLPTVNNVRYADAYAVEATDKTLTTYTFKGGTKCICSEAFSGCTSLTNITIPDSITTIGNSAFTECTSLSSITIPDSVTSIGAAAFRHCVALTGFSIGINVTKIGDYAFFECTHLITAIIPNNVTSVGEYCFGYCQRLSATTIGSGWTTISNNTYTNCGALTSITSLPIIAPRLIGFPFGVPDEGTLYIPQGSSGYDDWLIHLGDNEEWEIVVMS